MKAKPQRQTSVVEQPRAVLFNPRVRKGLTTALMKGKSYNRGVRAHKLVSEAMFRLMWSAFVEWYASADDVSLNEEERVLQCISDGIHALQQDQGNVSETVAQLGDDLRELSTLFKTFKEIGKSSKASIESRKSINTEEAMPTVIVLITLPTNIVIIFVRIILKWNINDQDSDHVDAGNQERAELAGGPTFANSHFFIVYSI